MQPITDIHTHILPGIDDGAASPSQAAEMLTELKNQGVTRIVLTPHFYPFRQSLNEFLADRDLAIELLSTLPIPEGIELLPAAEVQLHDALLNYTDLDALKIPGTDYLLTELPADFVAGKQGIKKILKLIYNCNCTPLLAHIERYPALLKNSKAMQELIEEGCKMQINLDCLHHNPILQRQRIYRYLKKGYIHALGTDCHNLSTRPPKYRKYLCQLEKILGGELTDALAGATEIF